MKISEDQLFLKYSEKPKWDQQRCHIQSYLNHLFPPFLMLCLNFNMLYSLCFYDGLTET